VVLVVTSILHGKEATKKTEATLGEDNVSEHFFEMNISVKIVV
jgi:hypothetical protein